jgi:hypothetical protein
MSDKQQKHMLSGVVLKSRLGLSCECSTRPQVSVAKVAIGYTCSRKKDRLKYFMHTAMIGRPDETGQMHVMRVTQHA